MPYTTLPFYTVTYNQPDDSVRGWEECICLLLAEKLSSTIIRHIGQFIEYDSEVIMSGGRGDQIKIF